MLVLAYLMNKSLIFKDISYLDNKLKHKLSLIFIQLKNLKQIDHFKLRFPDKNINRWGIIKLNIILSK